MIFSFSDAANNAPVVDDRTGQIELATAMLKVLQDGEYSEALVQVGRVFERKGHLHVADASMKVGSSPYRNANDDVYVRVSLVVPNHLLRYSGLADAVAAQAQRSEEAHRAAKVARLSVLDRQVDAITAERAKLEAEIAEISGTRNA